MAKTIMASDSRVGVVLENATAGITTSAPTNLHDADVLGPLYDNATTLLLTELDIIESITIDGFDPIFEDFQTVQDVYMKYREIRQDGSITMSIVVGEDSAAAGDQVAGTDPALARNWEIANKDWRFGVTTIAANVGSYNALDDDNGGDKAADERGWAVELVVNGLLRYTFHNCKMSITGRDIAFQKALRYTLKFEDARVIEIQQDGWPAGGDHTN